MTVLQVRKTPHAVAMACLKMLNELRREVTAGSGTAKVHNAITSTPGGDAYNPTGTSLQIVSANASDLATSVTLGSEIRTVWMRHYVGTMAHKVADTVNVLAAADPTDLATGITCANEIKADYELHRASTTYHYVADATNTIAAVDATDQSSLNTLLNELKTDINAHITTSLGGSAILVVNP